MLELIGVDKFFGDVAGLRQVSLKFKRGETAAILGPSGCGKTTLLRCIALFEEISAGEIRLDGKPVITVNGKGRPRNHVDVNKYRTHIGMVFQHLHIWPHRRILGNLILAPQVVQGMPKDEAKERALALLKQMGVADKANEYPFALSGGQLQRVALARALIMQPRILLLDEITSALDRDRTTEIMKLISDLAKDGLTIIAVTHDTTFAEFASRVVLFNDGRVVGDESLENYGIMKYS